MAVHLLEIATGDLKVPRARPCQATGTGPGAVPCGATPASRWRRTCLNGHQADVDLCGTHAQIILTCFGACADCVARGAPNPLALLQPLDLVLLGHVSGPPPRTGPVLAT